MAKKALLIGATGLVGSHILELSLADASFDEVVVFARRPTGKKHSKLVEHVVDFAKMGEWAHLVRGDVGFSALGTTRAQAGGIENQRVVDYTYQLEFAKACAKGGVKTFVLISSAQASSRSHFAYTKMKGELEDAVTGLGFEHLEIIRPGPLVGHREKPRLSERLGFPVVEVLSRLPGLENFKPIAASKVAAQAVSAAHSGVV